MVNNIPRSTAYRHKKRVLELGRWQPLSTRPCTRPAHATPVDVEAEVVRLRLELAEIPGQECGADTVGYYLCQVATEPDQWKTAKGGHHAVSAQQHRGAFHLARRARLPCKELSSGSHRASARFLFKPTL